MRADYRRRLRRDPVVGPVCTSARGAVGFIRRRLAAHRRLGPPQRRAQTEGQAGAQRQRAVCVCASAPDHRGRLAPRRCGRHHVHAGRGNPRLFHHHAIHGHRPSGAHSAGTKLAGGGRRPDRTRRQLPHQHERRADRLWPPGRRHRHTHVVRRGQAGDRTGGGLPDRRRPAYPDAEHRRLVRHRGEFRGHAGRPAQNAGCCASAPTSHGRRVSPTT